MKKFLLKQQGTKETSATEPIDLIIDEDSDSESEPKKKKRRNFNEFWLQDSVLRNWLIEKPKNTAYCKVCDISLKAVGGKWDLLAHGETLKHKNLYNGLKFQPTISSTLATKNVFHKAKELELRLSTFCVEHNLPFTCVDHLIKLLKNSESDAITKLRCGRMKASLLVKNVLGLKQFADLCLILKGTKFSLCIDESTDCSTTKLLSVIIRFSKNYFVKDCFLTLLKIKNADAISIYKCMKDFFTQHNIDYKTNMIGFAADGASVMTGSKHSVAKLFKDEIPNLFILKCVCHSINLTSSNACRKLPDSVEQLTRDIYNYVANSPKRIQKFEEIQSLIELKPKKLLHPSQTRWLSLQSVVARILELFESIKIYFGFIVNIDNLEGPKHILNKLMDPIYKCYLEFLGYILPIINNINRLFQSESPQIHILLKQLKKFLMLIFDNYLERSYFENIILVTDIIHNNPLHFVDLKDIYLGAQVNIILSESSSLSQSKIDEFKIKCRDFYIELVDQILKRFDFHDKILDEISFIDPDIVMSQRCRSIAKCCTYFPNLVNATEIPEIDSEWRQLRNVDFSSYSFATDVDVENFWRIIIKTERNSGQLAFPRLGKFVFQILSLPNSSASVERTFSQINLNKSKIRNRLKEDTLTGILRTKDYLKLQDCFCYNLPINKDLIDRFNSNIIYNKNNEEET